MQGGCRCLIGEEFVLRMIDGTEETERFLSNTVHSHIHSHSYFRYCPGSACSMIAYRLPPHHGTSERTVYCPECGIRFCFRCTYDHPGYKCRQYIMTAAKSQQSKPCPKCHAMIVKTGGCEDMTCRLCKHRFCFKCLQPIAVCQKSDCVVAVVNRAALIPVYIATIIVLILMGVALVASLIISHYSLDD